MSEQIKVGRPRKVQYELRSKNDESADLIRQARFSGNVCKSLQPYDVIIFKQQRLKTGGQYSKALTIPLNGAFKSLYWH